MFKSLASVLVPLAVIAVLFMELIDTPFYTDKELATAREKTVDFAASGNFNEAFARFDALFDIAPNDQKVWGDYIIVLMWNGEQERALQLADQHLDIQHAPLYVIHELFAAYLREGEAEKALALALASMPRADDPSAYALVRSQQLADAGHPKQALQLISSALNKEPENPQLIAARLSLQLLFNETAAQRELRLQLAKYPDNSALQNVQAEAAVIRARNGEYASALKELSQLYQQQPYNIAIAADYLVILSWSGRHREAVTVYERVAGDKLPAYARESAAVSLLWSGRINEADAIMSELSRHEPDAQRYARGLALVRVAQGDNPAAIDLLVPFKQQSEADTLELLGYLYIEQQQPQLAASYFSRAFALQEAADRAYLPWFNAIEKAAGQDGLTPYLPALQSYLPGTAPDPIVARYIVLLLQYDQDQAARQLVASYPFNQAANRQATPADQPSNKLTLPALAKIRNASSHSSDTQQEILFYDKQAGDSDVEEEEEEEEFGETEAMENADNREFFLLLATNDSLSGSQSTSAKAATAVSNDRLAQQLEWEAKTARDRGDLKTAIKLYRFGNQHYPDNKQLQLGLAMSLSEAGQSQEASQILSQLSPRYPADRQVQDAAVYHFRKYQLDAELMAALEKLMPITSGSARDSTLKSWITILLSGQVYQGPAQQLQALQSIATYYPGNSRWWLTRALLESRLGNCPETLSALENVNPATADEKMLDTAGFVARQCQDFNLASRYYTSGIKRYPDSVGFVAGQALSSTDGGNPAAALQQLDQHEARFGQQRDFLFARAYANDAAGNFPAAASDYETLLQRWPDDREAFSAYVMAVNHAGDPATAIALAYQHDDWLSSQHWQRLHADEATITLRDADRPDVSTQEKQQLIASALQQLDRNIADLQARQPVDQQLLLNARFDRVATFYIGGQMQTCISEYQALAITPAETPNYLLIMVADAYMFIRQPTPAIELLKEANRRDATDQRAQAALFYAYLDSEQYQQAGQLIKHMQSQADNSDNPAVTPWQDKLAAMFEAYRNHLALAQQQLEGWLRQTPTDSDLKIKLAAVYRWRGWPEKALPLYDQVLAENPQSIDALVGKNYAMLQLREYPLVAAEVESLVTQYPNNNQVRLMDSDWNLHTMHELDSRISAGKSDGGTFANRELVFDTHLYSSPLAGNYRVFGHTYYATAELPDSEGDVDVMRAGVGGDYRSRHFSASAELSEALDDNGDMGVTLAGSWQPDDYWTVGTLLQSYSLLVPIRAINQDIDGKSADLSVQYQWHEGHYVRGAGSYVDFSDGNIRKALHLNHYHRVFENEHHTIALMEQVYWSENSKGNDVAYYNPDNDYSLGAVFLYDGILRRRYEKKFSHHLAIGLGSYNQQDYESKLTWDIEYSHTWNHSRFLEWSYGVVHRNRSYDGKDEEFNALFGRVNWRF